MKPACLFVAQPFDRNSIFENTRSTVVNRDDQMAPWRLLREEMAGRGYDLMAPAYDAPLIARDAEFALCMEMPPAGHFAYEVDYSRRFLIILEPYVVRPDNWYSEHHDKFSIVFTWSEKLASSSGRYRLIRWPQVQPFSSPHQPHLDFGLRKLCTMISGGKSSVFEGELYSARVSWIHWFEREMTTGRLQAGDFEFYGRGWKEFFERHRENLRSWGYRGFLPSWNGEVTKKHEVLERYKFAICFENQVEKGYVTEKIFDCLFAGTIPLYFGDPGIGDKIPRECFLDARDFSSKEAACLAMTSMTRDEWRDRQQAIKKFLDSEDFEVWKPKHFVNQLVTEMLREVERPHRM